MANQLECFQSPALRSGETKMSKLLCSSPPPLVHVPKKTSLRGENEENLPETFIGFDNKNTVDDGLQSLLLFSIPDNMDSSSLSTRTDSVPPRKILLKPRRQKRGLLPRLQQHQQGRQSSRNRMRPRRVDPRLFSSSSSESYLVLDLEESLKKKFPLINQKPPGIP